MVFKFLRELKEEVGQSNFEIILSMTDQDIKFNRIKFGKITGPEEFKKICTSCKDVFMRY